MSAPIFGKGSTLTWNGVAIAKLTNIGLPEITVDSIDKTTHDSTGRAREFMSGLYDPGEISLEGNFDVGDTTGQIAMFTDAKAGTERTFVITTPSSEATFTCTGFISKIKPIGDAPIDNKLPFTASIKITGEPVLAITTVTGMSAIGFSNDVLMMPTFAIGTYSYAVTITNGETSTVITPVDATSGEVITITGPDGTSQTVATGVASSAITIASDELNVITVVISKTGYASKTYTFRCAVLAA